ncbi:ImmA/IrrE family metallo-endopeptidase [Paenibacillus sp. MY03]|nr:ImmA/IrrE family metallo-endopeptidase [Paenibacillus sp. MY03]
MIKQAVAQLSKFYGTNCPYDIASQRNILVLFEMLGEMLGYFNTYRRTKMIHINSDISEEDQRFTCAHELGHALLHPGVSTPFLRRHTLQSIDKIERQANQFAAELLIPDKLLLEGMSVYEAAAICGVPEEVANLKNLPKRSFWNDEQSYINL